MLIFFKFWLLRFQETGLVLALALVNAVEVVNKAPLLAEANITLGYQIMDSCSDVSTALRATKELMQQGGCSSSGNTSSCSQPILAVVGASYSEISIAVARQLTLRMIPQVGQKLETNRLVLGAEAGGSVQNNKRKAVGVFFLVLFFHRRCVCYLMDRFFI